MSYRKSLSLILAAVAVFTASASPQSAAIAKEAGERPHMDLAFCIDTTGSMQNEIDMVKNKTKELVAKLSTGKPAPIVRVGLVAYRDRGDEYVTKVFQFSDNIDQVVKDISDLKAAGGGDGPESVNEGLHVALNSLAWSKDSHTAKLLFLIGDAGPHFYPNDYKWEDESKSAISRGIQINTIACSGLEQYAPAQGSDVFKQIAKLSDGKYDTLAYRTEIVYASGKKSTLVTAGGASYRLAAGEKDWKSAAVAGRLERASAPAPATATAMMGAKGAFLARGRAAGGGGFGAARAALMSDAPASAPARSDSNLDEVLLDAARAKAKTSLNVHY
ncbi:MAG TPA: vWA domain-containing protein [Drouetiella sp.]